MDGTYEATGVAITSEGEAVSLSVVGPSPASGSGLSQSDAPAATGTVEPCRGCLELGREAGYWRTAHRKAVEREEKLKEEIKELRAKLKLRERQLFGRKSERGSKGKGKRGRRPDEQPNKRRRGQQPGAPGHGRRMHNDLPAREELVELDPSEPVCRCCGLPLRERGDTEDSEVVEVQVQAHRRVIRRKRYQPTCDCPDQPRQVTAPCPPKLVPKGGFGISFWVMVLIDKFLFQRPTCRLLEQLRLTVGLDVSQGTVTGGLKRLLPALEPLYDAIVERNVSEARWHADETRWLVLGEIEGETRSKWYLWVFRSTTTVVYRLEPSRGAEVPKGHFGEQAEGILCVDRYSAYKTLVAHGTILLAFCWAHVRRDFLAVAKDWPHLEAWGFAWVDRIAGLYRLNAARLAASGDVDAFMAAESKLRQAVEQMEAARDAELADPKLHGASRKVLESLERHWEGLVLFVEHPEVPMDNNEAERALRNPVVGRKNYYGSGAPWSAKLTAILFSLLQTLLAWNVHPHRWLTTYLNACAEHRGAAPPDAVRYLPWNLGEDQRAELCTEPPPWGDTS